MTRLHRLASIVRWLLGRTRAEQALDDELRTFVDMSAADKVRDGMPPAQARRLAMLELGGLEQAKERVRTSRHGAGIDELGRDARYAFRMLLKAPAFSAIVVLTLALGIGANTAIFGLIDALLLRWLPVARPQELVQFALGAPGTNSRGAESFSYPIARLLADQDDLFGGVAGFSSFGFEAGPAGGVVRVPGAMVTGSYYEALGLKPVVGRLLTRADDEPGAPLVAVISHGYWERRFAKSDTVVGQSIRINASPVVIVGVSPPGFVGAHVGLHADITMTVATLPRVSPSSAPLLGTGNFWLRVLARPRPGLAASAVAAQLNARWRQILRPAMPTHWPADRQKMLEESVFQATPGGTGWTFLREVYRKPLLVLMALVALVLLLACANVASLLLARSATRQKEIAVRMAIGAGRGRIVRQLLMESAVLSAIGAACGLALAWVSSRILVSMIVFGQNAIVFDLTPNWHVLGFTAAVAIASTVVFGLMPALQTTAAGPFAALTEKATIRGSRSRLLLSLVSVQVAISLILLAGAGLFVRTLQNLRALDPGFNADEVLLVDLEGRRTSAPSELLEEVRRLPSVVTAALSTHTPLSGAVWSDIAVPAGQPMPLRDNAFFIGAGPGFFAALQMSLVSGREFTDRDTAASPGVALVNTTFAARHFTGADPVGRYLSASVAGRRKDLEIVGVVEAARLAGLRREPPATVYVAYAQLTSNIPSTLVVRVNESVAGVAPAIQRAVRSVLPDAPIEVVPLSTQVSATFAQERMVATLGSGFGMLAMTLACIGLYGLLGYSVAQHTKEIGIRMALGAPAARMVAMVLRDGTRLLLVGIALGLPAAWGASRWVGSMLFGLTATDPVTIGGAILTLASAGLIAAYVPARRASRVDPLTALRAE